MRTTTTVLLWFLLLGAAAGDEEPAAGSRTPQEMADAVLAALEAGDGGAVQALALRAAPAPWLVAEELRLRGQRAQATAWAGAVRGKGTEALSTYLTSVGAAPAEGHVLELFRESADPTTREGWTASLEATEGLGGAPDSVVGIHALQRRGLACWVFGRLEESVACLRVAGEAAEQIGWTRRAAHIQTQCGKSAYRDGALEAAEQAWARALALQEALGEAPGIADALRDLGAAHFGQGETAAAFALFEREIGLRRSVGRPQELAQSLVNIGSIHRELREFPQALKRYSEAFALVRSLPPDRTAAGILNNMGLVSHDLGQYAQALESWHEAIAICQTLRDPEGMATVLTNLSMVRNDLGEYPRSKYLAERAMHFTKLLGRKPDMAVCENTLGLALMRTGDLDGAGLAFQRALEINHALGLRRRAAKNLLNMATVHAEKEDHDGALQALQRAFEVSEAAGDPAGGALALCYTSDESLRLGRFADALTAAQRAEAVLADRVDPTVRVAVLRALANAHHALAHWPEAVAHARAAVEGASRLSGGLGVEQGAAARAKWARVQDAGVLAALHLDAVGDLAWFLEMGRAGSLREALQAGSALRTAALPPALLREEASAAAEVDRAVAALRTLGGRAPRSDVQAARKRLDHAQALHEEMVARIQRTAKAGAALTHPRADDLATIRARLDPREALVLYGLTQGRAVALVVQATGSRALRLAPTEEVEAAAAALSLDSSDSEYEGAAARLRALVIDPLRLDASVERVFLSPMGRLGFIPFSLLLPGRELAYVPSGTSYGLLRELSQQHGEGVLAVGDPDYDHAVREVAVQLHRGGVATRLLALPATRKEVEAIGTVRLLGRDATEERFLEEVQGRERWRSVHLACHGLLHPDRPMLSSLALTASQQADGFLTCLEIYRQRVPADLVVLSACETGKGKLYRSEGIVGLTGAFMYAGAPRVLCSLWNVDDDATQALMIRFYDLWNPSAGKPGLGAAAALAQAQAFIRDQEKWKHPYYWAAWVLWGLAD